MAQHASPKVTGHKDELLPQLMSLSIEVIMILGDSIFVPFSTSTRLIAASINIYLTPFLRLLRYSVIAFIVFITLRYNAQRLTP
jgi:hypothetical protein